MTESYPQVAIYTFIFCPVQTDPYWSYRLQFYQFLNKNTDGPLNN